MRIPLRNAKHHFGAICVRGTRPYNEDAWQAGTIEVPAFAKRAPISLNIDTRNGRNKGDDDGQQAAESASGDPQVFYFGVFDGHGGDQCSHYLRDGLHNYVERSAVSLGMESTLQAPLDRRKRPVTWEENDEQEATSEQAQNAAASDGPETLISALLQSWRDTVGDYYRRFKPDYLSKSTGGRGFPLIPCILRHTHNDSKLEPSDASPSDPTSEPISRTLIYSFLSSDLDFVNRQVPPPEAQDFVTSSDMIDPTDNDQALGRHVHHSSPPFLGGSTCSLAMISTPTPTPFWHPSTPLTLVTAHVGDTRILLCSTQTGAPVPLTSEHHPASPGEATRLRRYAGSFTTDSFGEERFAAGLANTRAFGDVRSKRLGVSAEPELKLVHLKPGEGSFLVLCSDGVSGILSDQEIVDVVKEARTPEEGAKAVVVLAEELSVGEKGDSDNVTAMVVRLGGWERRSEGGGGSWRTKEGRDWRRNEANDPRKGRR